MTSARLCREHEIVKVQPVGAHMPDCLLDLPLHPLAPAGRVETGHPSPNLLAPVVDVLFLVCLDRPVPAVGKFLQHRLEVDRVREVGAVVQAMPMAKLRLLSRKLLKLSLVD